MKPVQTVGCEALRFLNVRSAYGQTVHAMSLKKLMDHFRFGEGPKAISDVDLSGSGIVFTNGLFDGRVVIDQLKIHRTGLLVQCANTTETCDQIIDEVIKMGPEVGLAMSDEEGRSYFSALVVELSISFTERFRILTPIMEIIDASLRKQHGGLVDETEGFGVHLWTNRSTGRPLYFKLEKRVHAAGENHFFSIAPVATSDHLMILDQIESIV